MRPRQRASHPLVRVVVRFGIAIVMLCVGGPLSRRATAAGAYAGVDAVPVAQAFVRWLREAFVGNEE